MRGGGELVVGEENDKRGEGGMDRARCCSGESARLGSVCHHCVGERSRGVEETERGSLLHGSSLLQRAIHHAWEGEIEKRAAIRQESSAGKLPL